MHILKADIFTLEKPDISILGLHFIFRIIAIMLNGWIIFINDPKSFSPCLRAGAIFFTKIFSK